MKTRPGWPSHISCYPDSSAGRLAALHPVLLIAWFTYFISRIQHKVSTILIHYSPFTNDASGPDEPIG
ncbi:MAG: hypothetical protein ACFFCW_49525 [Candidatus Hodarchaeota archaeon]